MTCFLCRITAPKTQEITITLKNFYLLGYALGFVLVLYGMPADASSSGMRYYTVFVVGVIDYFLGVQWGTRGTDRPPSTRWQTAVCSTVAWH